MITMPGLIDPHVHFRTPGQSYKEDFTTGTMAALAGGFTTVLDMPNNLTPITTVKLLNEKIKIAKQQIVCDVGFYFGSLGNNLTELKKIQPMIFGIKIYLNQTTGGFIVDAKVFKKICKAWSHAAEALRDKQSNLPILLHAESDVIEQAIEIGHQAKVRIHICHVSSQKELEAIIAAKQKKYDVTCGVTPHHLFLTPGDVNKIGPFGLMKPQIQPGVKEFLWKNLQYVDVIESDHAPHTTAEKQSNKPPFGVPGLETTLGLLLTAYSENKITIAEIQKLCHDDPAKIFNIKQDKQTYIEIDENEKWTVNNSKLFTKCKWSPWNGKTLTGKVKRVFIRGTKVFEDGKVLIKPGFGKIIKPISD